MRKAILVIVLAFSCTDEDRTDRTLLQAGYTNIHIDGHGWNCGRDDDYCTEFHATGPAHTLVHGSVGCGLDTGCGKGCTIRIDP